MNMNEKTGIKKLSESRIIELLKLIVYERKSIKKSSEYLNINYISAKRLVKKFEKNKLRFCDKRLKIEFIEMREYVNKIRLNHQKIQDQEYQHFIMRRFKYTRPSEETEALSTKMNEVKLMIQNLNKEISENQQLINYLISILKPFKITKC